MGVGCQVCYASQYGKRACFGRERLQSRNFTISPPIEWYAYDDETHSKHTTIPDPLAAHCVLEHVESVDGGL